MRLSTVAMNMLDNSGHSSGFPSNCSTSILVNYCLNVQCCSAFQLSAIYPALQHLLSVRESLGTLGNVYAYFVQGCRRSELLVELLFACRSSNSPTPRHLSLLEGDLSCAIVDWERKSSFSNAVLCNWRTRCRSFSRSWCCISSSFICISSSNLFRSNCARSICNFVSNSVSNSFIRSSTRRFTEDVSETFSVSRLIVCTIRVTVFVVAWLVLSWFCLNSGIPTFFSIWCKLFKGGCGYSSMAWRVDCLCWLDMFVCPWIYGNHSAFNYWKYFYVSTLRVKEISGSRIVSAFLSTSSQYLSSNCSICL